MPKTKTRKYWGGTRRKPKRKKGICYHDEWFPIKTWNSNDHLRIKKQCISCASVFGRLALTDVPTKDLHDEDKDLINTSAVQDYLERLAYQKRYLKYLKSREWGLLRVAIFSRDKYTCRRCHIVKPFLLQCHHLTYDNIFNESLVDLITVCGPCHELLHNLNPSPYGT